MPFSVKSSSIRRRPSAPKRAQSAGSRSKTSSLSASAAGSLGGTRKPLSPSATCSSEPPSFVATTGTPMPIASMTTPPNGSGCAEGSTKMFIAA